METICYLRIGRGNQNRRSPGHGTLQSCQLADTASFLRGGELLRQAIQHSEYCFNAVAGEERQRRRPERADRIGNDLLGSVAAGAGEKADRYSKHRAEHETYDVFAQIARGKKTIAHAAQIAPQNVSH